MSSVTLVLFLLIVKTVGVLLLLLFIFFSSSVLLFLPPTLIYNDLVAFVFLLFRFGNVAPMSCGLLGHLNCIISQLFLLAQIFAIKVLDALLVLRRLFGWRHLSWCFEFLLVTFCARKMRLSLCTWLPRLRTWSRLQHFWLLVILFIDFN